MRILVVKVPHEEGDRYTWMVAYSLPFTPVGACNYGCEGDVVNLHLTVNPKTPREVKAQDIFADHVKKVAESMNKRVSTTYHSPENIVATGHRGMSLSWVTDHVTKGADHE
jgi:hypothetical protein